MSAKFFRHRDGGLYQHQCTARYSVDASCVEVYAHLWPFEQGTWVRPTPEFWDGRFTKIDFSAIADARNSDRAEAQAVVNASKALRKKTEVEKADDYDDLSKTLDAWGHACKDPLIGQLLLRAQLAVKTLAKV